MHNYKFKIKHQFIHFYYLFCTSCTSFKSTENHLIHIISESPQKKVKNYYEYNEERTQCYRGSSGKSTFKHVESGGCVANYIFKLRLDDLSIKVGNRIFKRIFVSLLTVAFVSSRFVSSSKNRNTLIKINKNQE